MCRVVTFRREKWRPLVARFARTGGGTGAARLCSFWAQGVLDLRFFRRQTKERSGAMNIHGAGA
jgi:hypothetical protein